MRAVLRWGLCALIAFAVLAYGAVETWSISILELGAGALFLVWGVGTFRARDPRIEWNPLAWPLLAYFGLGLTQLAFGRSAYPFLTRTELLKLLALFLLFFLAVQAFRARSEFASLGWFLLSLGFAVSLFGIVQYFTFNGKLYWFQPLVLGGAPFGPYVNRNHFAGFVELIAPLGLAVLILRAVQPELLALAALFTVIQVAALFLSASRGGIVGFLVEISLLALLLRGRSRGRTRYVSLLLILLAASALGAWLGAGRLFSRFSPLKTGEVTMGKRVAMFKSSWRIFLDHPLTGTGLGTLVSVFPRYDTLYDGKVVDHAHNEYVEGLAESGLAGAVCGIAFLLILFRQSLRELKEAEGTLLLALHGGALAACCGLLVHSLVDFNLRIPANALLFLFQAFLATSPRPQPRAGSGPGRSANRTFSAETLLTPKHPLV